MQQQPNPGPTLAHWSPWPRSTPAVTHTPPAATHMATCPAENKKAIKTPQTGATPAMSSIIPGPQALRRERPSSIFGDGVFQRFSVPLSNLTPPTGQREAFAKIYVKPTHTPPAVYKINITTAYDIGTKRPPRTRIPRSRGTEITNRRTSAAGQGAQVEHKERERAPSRFGGGFLALGQDPRQASPSTSAHVYNKNTPSRHRRQPRSGLPRYFLRGRLEKWPLEAIINDLGTLDTIPSSLSSSSRESDHLFTPTAFAAARALRGGVRCPLGGIILTRHCAGREPAAPPGPATGAMMELRGGGPRRWHRQMSSSPCPSQRWSLRQYRPAVGVVTISTDYDILEDSGFL